MHQPQGPPVVVVSPEKPKIYPIHGPCAFGIGITLLVVGVLSIIFQIAALAVGINLAATASGIWSGVMFILAGSFGMVAAITKTKCKVITFMVLCIVGGAFAAGMFNISAIAVHNDSYNSYWEPYGDTGAGLNGTLLFLSIVAGVMCILGAVASCLVCCPCCKKDDSNVLPVVTPSTTQHGPGAQGRHDGQTVTLRPVPNYPGHFTIDHDTARDHQYPNPPAYSAAVHVEGAGLNTAPDHTLRVHQPVPQPVAAEEMKY